MAPVGTQFEHNQGDSDQHGPCQSSWFTGADSSQNVMKNVSYQFFKKSSSLVVDILFDTHLFSVFFFGLGAFLFSVSILYLQLFVTLERLTSAALVPLEMKRCEKFLKCSDTSLSILIQPAIYVVYDLCIHCILCALIPFNKMCIKIIHVRIVFGWMSPLSRTPWS